MVVAVQELIIYDVYGEPYKAILSTEGVPELDNVFPFPNFSFQTKIVAGYGTHYMVKDGDYHSLIGPAAVSPIHETWWINGDNFTEEEFDNIVSGH